MTDFSLSARDLPATKADIRQLEQRIRDLHRRIDQIYESATWLTILATVVFVIVRSLQG